MPDGSVVNSRMEIQPMVARNSRLEAQRVVGDGFAARVLEPSPPAVVDGQWFADDPVAVGDGPEGVRVVSPVPGTDLTWTDWLRGRPEQAGWAQDRWLGAYRRLAPVPPSFADTRAVLHRVAVYVVSPARRRSNGKIGLRWTMGGLGTPFFAGPSGDEQVRLIGGTLVRQVGETTTTDRLTNLNRAAAFVLDGPPDTASGEGFDVPALGDPDAELAVDDAAAEWLGDWIGFGWSVLEELRAAPSAVEPTRVQLWPEHFDAAFDCRMGNRRRLATFGASPGDPSISEPYFYVLPADFDELPSSDLWNASGFSGRGAAPE